MRSATTGGWGCYPKRVGPGAATATTTKPRSIVSGFIKGAQWLDLTLDKIRELLELWDSGACPCGPASAVLRERIAAIDHQATRLRQMRRVLCAMLGDDPVAAAGTAPEGAASLVGKELSDDAEAGCGCCRAATTPTREDEIQELQARLAAVQRRLRNVGAEVARTTQRGD
jgi:DNA-binding transcriptional MerR regulator